MPIFWFKPSILIRRFPVPLPWRLTHPISAACVNCFRLCRFLIVAPPAWFFRFTQMLWFIIVLLPGFLPVAYYYLYSPNILRNVQYGPNARNFMDIYLPTNNTSSSSPTTGGATAATASVQEGKSAAPVVVFVCGGVWIIGYKAWGALMGRILAANGILSIMPDYRNFPQGSISDMLLDVNTAIQYIFDTALHYGGDLSQVTLVGQSAGAHLVLLSYLNKVKSYAQGGQEVDICAHTQQWQFDSVKRCVCVSGPYDIGALENHFHKRGLYRRILRAIFEGGPYENYSPTQMVLNDPTFSNPKVVSQLPEIYLFHGSGDQAVPDIEAFRLSEALQSKNIRCNLTIYKGKSHTDPIIEDLMHVDKDGSDLMADIASLVLCDSLPTKPRVHAPPSFYQSTIGCKTKVFGRRNLVPKCLVWLARKFNPF